LRCEVSDEWREGVLKVCVGRAVRSRGFIRGVIPRPRERMGCGAGLGGLTMGWRGGSERLLHSKYAMHKKHSFPHGDVNEFLLTDPATGLLAF
jgi:hypothetical protein